MSQFEDFFIYLGVDTVRCRKLERLEKSKEVILHNLSAGHGTQNSK